MGVISFLPIQPGEGEPSQHNRRPIYAPLNIDGIGKIWGGDLDTSTGTLVSKWNGIIFDGVNEKVNSEYFTDATIRAGRVYLPKVVSGEAIPTGIATRRKLVLTDSIAYMNVYPDDSLPYFGIPTNGRLYVIIAVAYRADYPEITTAAQCIAFVNEWLSEHPAQFVYMLTPSVYTTYHLTTAKLNQALSQLGVPISSMQEVMHQIAMDAPHLITPTAAEMHTFSTNMVAPLRECKVHFSPVQEGTGDPSPDNVRAISGWTGFTFYRCGKNLTIAKDGATMLTLPSVDSTRRDTILGLPTGENFVMSCKVSTGIGTSSGRRLYLYGISSSSKFISTGTVQDGTNGIVNSPYSVNGSLSVSHNKLGLEAVYEYLYDIQLERGTTPTAYEEYNGIRQEIDWTSIGEIPGGYIDLVQNALVVDTFYLVFDGTENWKRNGSVSSKYYYYVNIPEQAVVGNCICSHEVQKSLSINNTTLGCNIANVSNVMSFLIRLNADTGAMSSLDDFKAWVASQYSNGTPLTAVGTLETPIVYPLNPITPIKTLRGLNNIWSNANGVIELSYWKH